MKNKIKFDMCDNYNKNLTVVFKLFLKAVDCQSDLVSY